MVPGGPTRLPASGGGSFLPLLSPGLSPPCPAAPLRWPPLPSERRPAHRSVLLSQRLGQTRASFPSIWAPALSQQQDRAAAAGRPAPSPLGNDPGPPKVNLNLQGQENSSDTTYKVALILSLSPASGNEGTRGSQFCPKCPLASFPHLTPSFLCPPTARARTLSGTEMGAEATRRQQRALWPLLSRAMLPGHCQPEGEKPPSAAPGRSGGAGWGHPHTPSARPLGGALCGGSKEQSGRALWEPGQALAPGIPPSASHPRPRWRDLEEGSRREEG